VSVSLWVFGDPVLLMTYKIDGDSLKMIASWCDAR
jgi:hypothetical protein